MKKLLILSSITLLLGLLDLPAQGQQVADPLQNYVVIIKKVKQLKPILLSAQALKEADGEDFGDFQIIICGKNITGITNLETMVPLLSDAGKAEVQIIACGFSLKKFDVDPARIPGGIKVVDNGILYNFQLQKKGYKSIEL